MSVNGKCLCGGVQYRLSVSPADLAYCHCSECQRALGTAFASYARVAPDSFQWTAGQELISKFEWAPTANRCFCSVCGSQLGVIVGDGDDLTWVGLGATNCDPGTRPEAHVFVDEKAPWHEITDDLPQFEEMPSESSEFFGRF